MTHRTIRKAASYTILIIAAFVSIFPFYWILAGATNTSNELAQGKLTIGPYFLVNMWNLFHKYKVVEALSNSIKIALITVVFSLLATSLAAYGFEKFRTKWSERIYSIYLLAMMIPFSAMMIPLFKMMADLKLVNTSTAVILPAISSVFLIFFFRQNFKAFPDDVLEAAKIDGAGDTYIFFKIVMPNMKSTYAAAAIYAFMTSWNNYLWPLVVLQSPEKKTMTLLISDLAAEYYVVDYSVQMAGILIAILPMTIVFFVMQKSFVEGLTGSVKG